MKRVKPFKKSLVALAIALVGASSAHAVTYELHIRKDGLPSGKVVQQYSGYRAWSDDSLAASCNEYRTGKVDYAYRGATGDGVYRIDVDGAGGQAPFDVNCDMTTNGGGYTTVMVLKANQVAEATSPPIPTQSLSTYLPKAQAVAIAKVSSEIRIQEYGTSNYIASKNPLVMENLRNGLIANYTVFGDVLDHTSYWSLSSPTLTQLTWFHATSLCTPVGGNSYPSVFWSCGNGQGIHITLNLPSPDMMSIYWDAYVGENNFIVSYR